MEKVKISQVVPDENQPRKMFAPEKLATLKKSVEKHGIMTPLIVEKDKQGKYLLIDGERRFRVASDLGLKEVPVVIMAPQSKVDRTIQQFHIQEQHENWSATEKAMVIFDLSQELKLGIEDACQILGIPKRTAQTYMAFAKLVDKEYFTSNHIPIDWADAISSLKTTVKRVYRDNLEQEFTRNDEKKLEKVTIERIKAGDIAKPSDMGKLKDSFAKEPKSISSYFTTNISPDALFLKTKAKGAYHLRNVKNNAGYVQQHIGQFMQIGDVKVDSDTMRQVKEAYKLLKEFIGRYDDLVE